MAADTNISIVFFVTRAETDDDAWQGCRGGECWCAAICANFCIHHLFPISAVTCPDSESEFLAMSVVQNHKSEQNGSIICQHFGQLCDQLCTLYPESFPNMQSHVLIWILWPGMWEMWLQKIPVNPKSDLFIPILHLKGREVHTPDIYIAVKNLHKKEWPCAYWLYLGI